MYGIFNQNMSELQTLSEYISITSYTYMYMYIHFIYHTVLVHIFCIFAYFAWDMNIVFANIN